MNFARDGYAWMALSGSIAVAVLATAVWRRSWSMWLLGFALLVLAAWVAWTFRTPAPPTHRTATRDASSDVTTSFRLMTSASRPSHAMPLAFERAT